MYDKNLGEFRFQPGSVYTNLFLADEINRTSPKTQSALLEVMEEGKATVEGVTRELPNPFFVIATQNPFGSSGTQRLPESQLDRFIICESIGYPDTLSATAILKGSSEKDLGSIVPIINKEELLEMQKAVNNMHVDECLYDYIVEITEGTRRYDVFDLGLSPRGSIALLKMSKAYAYIQGRDYVTPDDVKAVYLPVSLHRVKLSSKSKAAGLPLEAALMNVLAAVNIPKIDFAQK